MEYVSDVILVSILDRLCVVEQKRFSRVSKRFFEFMPFRYVDLDKILRGFTGPVDCSPECLSLVAAEIPAHRCLAAKTAYGDRMDVEVTTISGFFPSLRSLVAPFWNCRLEDLPDFANLKILSVGRVELTNGMMSERCREFIGNMEQMKVLNMTAEQCRTVFAAPVNCIRQVFIRGDVKRADIILLRKNGPSLVKVAVKCESEMMLDWFDGWPKLQKLTLEGEVSHDSSQHMVGCPSLFGLELVDSKKLMDFSFLANFLSLTTLNLARSSNFGATDLRYLQCLASLRKLNVSHTAAISDELIEVLISSGIDLCELNAMNWNYNDLSRGFTSTGVTKLLEWAKCLKVLDIPWHHLVGSEIFIADGEYVHTLEWLDLEDTSVSMKGIDNIVAKRESLISSGVPIGRLRLKVSFSLNGSLGEMERRGNVELCTTDEDSDLSGLDWYHSVINDYYDMGYNSDY